MVWTPSFLWTKVPVFLKSVGHRIYGNITPVSGMSTTFKPHKSPISKCHCNLIKFHQEIPSRFHQESLVTFNLMKILSKSSGKAHSNPIKTTLKSKKLPFSTWNSRLILQSMCWSKSRSIIMKIPSKSMENPSQQIKFPLNPPKSFGNGTQMGRYLSHRGTPSHHPF